MMRVGMMRQMGRQVDKEVNREKRRSLLAKQACKRLNYCKQTTPCITELKLIKLFSKLLYLTTTMYCIAS